VKHRETFAPVTTRVREILDATPEITTFGKPCLERILRFTEVLGDWGKRTNLTAHPEDPVEVAFHVIDSLAPLFIDPPVNSFGSETKVLDLGSGAGFPGLILAAASEAEFTLVEARRKRASFLSAAATDMALTNVRVVCARMTPATVDREFDVLTSRAVGEPAIELAAQALKPNCIAVLWTSVGQQIGQESLRRSAFTEVTGREYIVRRRSELVRRSLLILRRSPSVRVPTTSRP
jgi:16S rRNA (guanine(527)-N(7))-methyltransferase RsmG